MKHSIFILLALTAFNVSAFQIVSPPLMVKQPPKDELLFQVAQENKNDQPLVIECEAKGTPGPFYRWKKNGKLFDYEAFADRMSIQPGTGSLVITKPRDEDVGQYQCFAINELGIAASNSVFVRKAELKEFKEEEMKTMTANEGDQFFLSCTSPEGWPKPIIQWVIQDYQGAMRPINNSRITVDPEGILWFSHVTRQDASKDFYYVCTIVSPIRNEFKIGQKFLLNVMPMESSISPNKHEPEMQYVTRQNHIVFRGKKTELFCIFGGNPLPVTVWSKEGERIKTSDRVTFGNYGKSLILKNTDFEDEGSYTCEASNGVGRDVSYSINLKIMSEPFFTVEPKIVRAEENEDVKINCEAHGEPKPDIKWTFNSKPILEAPFNPRRQVTKNSIVIKNVTMFDTGNYGCNATNSIGYVYKDVYVYVSGAQA